jgi:hypothetical protein
MSTLFAKCFRGLVLQSNLNKWLDVWIMCAVVNAESTLAIL